MQLFSHITFSNNGKLFIDVRVCVHPPPLPINRFRVMAFPLATQPFSALYSHRPPSPSACSRLLSPLPLNLANNKQATSRQASNKQASKQHFSFPFWPLLCSTALGSTLLWPSHTLSKTRWWTFQIQVLSQKLTGGGSGQGRQVGRCSSKNARVVPKNNHFWPKTAPKPTQNGHMKGNGCYTPRAPRLPGNQEPFVALDMSTIRPRNGPKKARNGLNVRHLSQTAPKPRMGLSWAAWLKTKFRGHLVHP